MNVSTKYIFAIRNGNFYNIIKQCFIIECLWNQYIKEKYYKGTDSILYFPYVPYNDLKICPKVKTHHYYGLKADNIIFDEFLLPDLAKEYEPGLSGKLNDITVENW